MPALSSRSSALTQKNSSSKVKLITVWIIATLTASCAIARYTPGNRPISSAAQCRVSAKDSHGFFCEADKIWKIRKEIFHAQELLQAKPGSDTLFSKQNGRAAWIMNNYEPNFSCGLEKRIGRQGDGGKWLCDPHRIAELTKSQKRKCLIFSIGSNNDFSFENHMSQALPDCEIHTFDHTIVPKNVPENVNFHSLGLGPTDSGEVKTLSTIMKILKLGDKYSLEVLKVDIESAEWDIFVGDQKNTMQGLLAQDDFPFARQVLIELHPTDPPRTRRFFDLMSKNGYVITHKEPNLLMGGNLVEYTFLKTDLGEAASK